MTITPMITPLPHDYEEGLVKPFCRPGNDLPARRLWQRVLHRVRMFLLGGDW